MVALSFGCGIEELDKIEGILIDLYVIAFMFMEAIGPIIVCILSKNESNRFNDK